jgi:hypothetical protein
MKLSLSPASIKDFVVDHTEKVVFFIVSLSLLYFAWSAFFSRDVLKTRPEDILDKVGKAQKNLEESKPLEAPPRARSAWPSVASRAIPDDIYVQDKPFNPRHYPERKDDADPELLAFVRLTGQAVVGPIAVKGPGVVTEAAAEPEEEPEEPKREAAPKRDAEAEKPRTTARARAGEGRGVGPVGRGGAPMGRGVAIEEDEEDEPMRARKAAPRGAARVPLAPGTYGGVRPAGRFGYEGRRMIVLTGLVPVQAQTEEYRKAFTGKAPRPRREQNEPVYGFYRIERREIAPDGKASAWNEGFVPWTTLEHADLKGVKDVEDFYSDWADKAPPVTSKRYHDPLLTMPLPPLLLSDWGPEATHPEIPLLRAETKPPVQADPIAPMEDPPKAEPFDPELAAVATDAPRQDPFLQAGGPPVGGAGALGGEPRAEEAANEPPAQYKLFRFIDFNVKPGYKYQYRVQAYVQNPNYGIDPKYLAEDKQGKFNKIPMSEDSPLVAVPDDRRILGGRVAIDEDDGPVASAMVVRWENEQGTDIISEYQEKPRGAILDRPRSSYRIDPIEKDYVPIPIASKSDPNDLVHGVVVIDARGGDPVGDPMQAKSRPGEVLLLAPDGSLVVRRQTDDAAAFARRSISSSPPPKEAEEEPMAKEPMAEPPKRVGVVGGGRRPPPKTPPQLGVPLN